MSKSLAFVEAISTPDRASLERLSTEALLQDLPKAYETIVSSLQLIKTMVEIVETADADKRSILNPFSWESKSENFANKNVATHNIEVLRANASALRTYARDIRDLLAERGLSLEPESEIER